MSGLRRNLALCGAAVAAILAVGGYTKWVWQSGFDQGAAVSMCVAVSIVENGGKLAREHSACKDAEAYKSSPLWQLRRRNSAAIQQGSGQ